MVITFMPSAFMAVNISSTAAVKRTGAPTSWEVSSALRRSLMCRSIRVVIFFKVLAIHLHM